MATFSASDIDDLAYDFSHWIPEPDPELNYKPGKTMIVEPTSVQITAYFGAFNDLMRSQGRKIDEFSKRSKAATDANDPAEAERIEDEYADWSNTSAAEVIARRQELLAGLCSDNPCAPLLAKLPGRVFEAFQEYVQESLVGKGRRSATTS